MKYKIEVNGKGGEAFIHKLTDEQYESLQDGCVEDDLMDIDQISEVLGVDFLDTDTIITGIYQGSLSIKVRDESDNLVWESDEEFDFEDYEYDYKYNDGRYLSIEDYIKGNFFNYVLETDDDFNPELLTAQLVELLDGRSELITDIRYNNQEMEKEYGDTSSRGFTYMLN
jgi:hypothetical protein